MTTIATARYTPTETAPRGARTALYLRISQDTSGQRAGVDRQRTECLEVAERLGLDVVAEYPDNDVSAYSGKPRPQFERLMADADAGHLDVILVWAADRLYRQMADLVRITTVAKGSGVRIVTVTGGDVDLSTPDGLMQAQFTGMVAQNESGKKSVRVKARVRQRVQAGVMTSGRRPFGYRWADPCEGGPTCLHLDDKGQPTCAVGQDVRARVRSRKGLVIHEPEAAAVRRIYADVANGGSVRAATKWLAAEGFTGTGGAVMAQPTVNHLLTNPRYAGLVALKGQVHTDDTGAPIQAADGHAIVDVETFEKVRVRLADPSRRTNPGRPAQTLLSGIARCSVCGGPMNASTQDNGSKATGRQVRVPIYVCARSQHIRRRRELVDAPVVAAVLHRLERDRETLLAYARTEQDTPDPHVAEVDRLLAKLAEYDALEAADELAPADYARVTKATRARLEAAQAAAVKVAHRPALAALLATDDPVEAWVVMAAAVDPEPARAVLRDLLEAVVVKPAATPRRPTGDDLDVRFSD